MKTELRYRIEEFNTRNGYNATPDLDYLDRLLSDAFIIEASPLMESMLADASKEADTIQDLLDDCLLDKASLEDKIDSMNEDIQTYLESIKHLENANSNLLSQLDTLTETNEILRMKLHRAEKA